MARWTETGDPAERGGASALEAVLERLAPLVNWEKRRRSPGSQGSGMRVDIEPARELLRRLGDPSRGLRVVHVAGTKGKGSVCALVRAALHAEGLRVGAYASPHVERIHERIVLGDAPIGDGALAASLTAALDAREAPPEVELASWFDVLTAAAVHAFRAADVEWAIVECGLGGRLDSTNALRGEVCVVTNVDLEHTEVLGSTRAEIAAEKAGILEPGCTAVTGLAADDEAGRVVEDVARRVGADLRRPRLAPSTTIEPTTIEGENAALAELVLDALGERGVRGSEGQPVGARSLTPGARRAARLPGRMEHFVVEGVPVVLDGAHVASSLARVLDELEAEGVSGPPAVAIVGAGADKDLQALLKVVCARTDRVLCSSTGAGPVASPHQLAELATRFGSKAETADSPGAALQRALSTAGDGWILVTGSLHLVGAIRSLLPRDSRC